MGSGRCRSESRGIQWDFQVPMSQNTELDQQQVNSHRNPNQLLRKEKAHLRMEVSLRVATAQYHGHLHATFSAHDPGGDGFLTNLNASFTGHSCHNGLEANKHACTVLTSDPAPLARDTCPQRSPPYSQYKGRPALSLPDPDTTGILFGHYLTLYHFSITI